MSTGFASYALGALNQVQNFGQVGELVQGQLHQKEQISWTRRSYLLDTQSLRLDALDHAKEEIKSHYDTYVSRIDTLLLVLALIWPFALNLIQFSDEFVPGLQHCQHGDCVEVWVGLMAAILIFPFWGILMLIRCKLKLDGWLEYSLAGLNHKRREIVEKSAPKPDIPHQKVDSGTSVFSWENSAEQLREKEAHEETESIVHQLVTICLGYQEYLADIWNAECGWLVHTSTALLWMSVVAALLLTSLSIWIFLINTGGNQAQSSYLFASLVGLGAFGPFAYLCLERGRGKVTPPAFDEQGLIHDPFPLSSQRLRSMSFKHVSGISAANVKRDRDSVDFDGASHQRYATNGANRAVVGSFWRCSRRRHYENYSDSLLQKSLLHNGRNAGRGNSPRLPRLVD